MPDRYYWLKIHEHFFDDEKIMFLESQDNGEKYIVFWMKLLLKCLKNKDNENSEYGFLRFNSKLPYTVELLSKITRTDIDTVRVAMKMFTELEMIEILQDKTFYIEAISKLIGTESKSTERMRRHREKKQSIETSHVTNGDVTCDNNKELELNKEKDKSVELKPDRVPYKQIIEYLNMKCGTSYRHTTKATQQHIKARWNEGFKLDDFRTVINLKWSAWASDPKMCQYLRPHTLFGTKMESYLQDFDKGGGNEYTYTIERNVT